MTRSEHGPGRAVAAVLTIAATYVYFLLFAEFALLRLAEAHGGGPDAVRTAMAFLGAGGVGGSVLAAVFYRSERLRSALLVGFLLSAAAALLSRFVSARPLFLASAGGVGLGMGWLTVTLATGLRSMVPPKHLGVVCGSGTGLAYAFCNIPFVFAAPPQGQAVIAAGAALAGTVALRWVRTGTEHANEQPGHSGRAGLIIVVVVLTALVWLDSAAFFVIQQTTALKGATWMGNWVLMGNALVHFGAAVLAGFALDRRREGQVLAVAAFLLGAACLVLANSSHMGGARFLYTAGVSLYSAALVWAPARLGRPAFSAVLYAVAGWGGSAFGIGMAQELHHVPGAFVAIAFTVVIAALAIRWRLQVRGAAAAALVMLVCLGSGSLHGKAVDADPGVELGRQVYISEGCIHCHSQYVRPRVAADRLQWGPAVPLTERLTEQPPLFGNRRQGPDLAMVGNRRSSEWQRLHLIDPRAVVPGSRMPRYAHLFREGDNRGEALVAYLGSLGNETVEERMAAVAKWAPPGAALASADAAHGQKLFTALCAPCHGPTARGDGGLSARLIVRPPDFTRDEWRRLTPNDPALLLSLARIVKFGLPGSAMAGHEYLSDRDTVDLAAYVESVHKAGQTKP